MQEQIIPLGDRAVTIRFGEEISMDVHRKVRAFTKHLEVEKWSGVEEWVPSFAAVTLYYDPLQTTLQKLKELILEDIKKMAHEEEREPRLLHIPVLYGGESGPDLQEVAAFHQLDVEEVIRLHTEPEYIVYMIGFAPGFPYIGGLSKQLYTPRKEIPDLYIPAGSVAIGGQQTGVYPIQSPGGWHVIGRTPWDLFNPRHQPPSLLHAGDKIKFVAIDERQFNKERGNAPWQC
ncbi:5-oxoprolinase subunit PxpB [Bacillus sp. REN10]|uniref:5-oxoprolinase subunit PxpB n=1 Tax=Bacillus sp. REN10 TaxID=2782541 RepID=UPI00193B7B4C|nr:5-oxoprolinase subunit PxpB [Bacillus sp. REN10]